MRMWIESIIVRKSCVVMIVISNLVNISSFLLKGYRGD